MRMLPVEVSGVKLKKMLRCYTAYELQFIIIFMFIDK